MTADIPGPCPVCGGVTVAPSTQRSTLLAVCDVLVLKALEKLGNYIVRADRSRFRGMGTRPQYMAHTLWPATDEMVTKALKGAWDVVPALLDVHGCCDVTGLQVTTMLNEYVHDLAITGTAHSVRGEGGLIYRFETQLGLPVFDRTPHLHGHAEHVIEELEFFEHGPDAGTVVDESGQERPAREVLSEVIRDGLEADITIPGAGGERASVDFMGQPAMNAGFDHRSI